MSSPYGIIRNCEPETTEDEMEEVVNAVRKNQLSGHGDQVKEFEKEFAKYIGVKHCILTQNGSIAPYIALRAIGVGPGDEVIMPSQQISAVCGAISMTGATIVSVDVDRRTWTIDSSKISKAITSRTKAIIATPIFGGVSPNYHEILRLIILEKEKKNHRIFLIEDFAEAIGSKYAGRKIGSIGDIGTCSFYANKTLSTGEGGCLTTNSDELNKQIRYIRNCCFGDDEFSKYWAKDLPMNFRPHNLVGAIGLGQLKKIDYLIERRQDIHHWYQKYLSEKFEWQYNPYGEDSVCWMNAVIIPRRNDDYRHPEDLSPRDEFINYMKENGIETRPLFPPISKHPYLSNVKDNYTIDPSLKNIYPVYTDGEEVSQFLWTNGVILPSGGAKLTEDVVKYVCGTANHFIGE